MCEIAQISRNNLGKVQAFPKREPKSRERKMASPHNPMQNHLLAALPAAEFKRLSADLELVPLPLGAALYASGSHLQYVYFPTTAIVSLRYLLQHNVSVETALVSNEGMLGTSLFMDGDSAPSSAEVLVAGYSYRMKAQLLKQEFDRAGALQELFQHYTRALMKQMSQADVCSYHHTAEQQLCRRLLCTLERMPTNELTMTPELIANILCMNREGMTAAAANLKQAGIIQYSRGRIQVLDRDALEILSCECYAIVKQEFYELRVHTCETESEVDLADTQSMSIFRIAYGTAQASRTTISDRYFKQESSY
jgi:CRP-like cAMP-binding protein